MGESHLSRQFPHRLLMVQEPGVQGGEGHKRGEEREGGNKSHKLAVYMRNANNIMMQVNIHTPYST